MALQEHRAYWVDLADRLARPVLTAAAEGRLRASLPPSRPHRIRPASTEALARTLAGLAPWFELDQIDPDEAKRRDELCDLARQGIANLVDPASDDYCPLDEHMQNLVEAAFLSHALVRAPNGLWGGLDDEVRGRVADCLERSRVTVPGICNWLLFSAMVEAALRQAGRFWDRMRIQMALHSHEQWYLGDGIYGDGPDFHWDHYNSFVIQPMILDLVEIMIEHGELSHYQVPNLDLDVHVARSQRYAAIQERMISPEGALFTVGRSLTYRFGALQLLAQMALREQLPDKLAPAQARCAMTAAIRRLAETPGTFGEDRFLSIGFAGDQPSLGEDYISHGSVYLCCTALLPLGLPADRPFWSDPDADWTSKRIYQGEDLPADKHR